VGVTVTPAVATTVPVHEESGSMIRKLIRASLFAALGAVALVLSFGAAASTAQDRKDDKKKDAKVREISEIMSTWHSKKGSFGKLGAAVKGGKWEDAAELVKSYTTDAADLGKNKPPRGDAKSWESLTTKYVENVKAVSDGVEKKDATAAGTGLKAIGGSCKTCHNAHQPK
jgi:cytochrome c556